MAQYEWIFVADELADEAVHAVYETCDALVSRHTGLTLLTVTAQGHTAVEAAKTIIIQLQQERRIIKIQRAYEDL